MARVFFSRLVEMPRRKVGRLSHFARRRRAEMPPEERWFLERWTSEDGAQDRADEFCVPFHQTIISGCINRSRRYVIEIDPPGYDVEAGARRDAWLRKKGFVVFHIPAFDESAFRQVVEYVQLLKTPPPPEPIIVAAPKPFVPKIIVRRAKAEK